MLVDKDRLLGDKHGEIANLQEEISSLNEKIAELSDNFNKPTDKSYKHRQKPDFVTEKFVIGFAIVIFLGAFAYTKLRK